MKLNGLTAGETIYPGRILISPSLAGVSESTHAGVASLSSQLAYSHRNARSAPAPRTFNEHFQVGHLSRYAEHLVKAAESAHQGHHAVEAGMGKVLKSLESVGNQALQIHLGRMNQGTRASSSTSFQIDRIKTSMTREMEKIPEWLRTCKGPVSAVDSAHMSINDAARSFTTEGSALTSRRTATLLDGVNDRISRVVAQQEKLKIPVGVSKTLGKSLPVVGSALTAYNAYEDGRLMNKKAELADKKFGSSASEIVKVHESAKIGGSVLGAVAGGEIAAAFLVPMLLAGPVGWGAIAVTGIAIAGAAYLGGKGGEAIGSAGAKQALKYAGDGQDEFVDTVIDFSEQPIPLH